MQYLYVLVSEETDFYYEQFLLSVTSLKLVMPNATVVLLCDLDTKKTLVGKRSLHEELVSETLFVKAPIGMLRVEVSRWLKTSMRRYVTGDFIFIDCDTVVIEDLSSIDWMDIKFGACLDKHTLINRHSKNYDIIRKDKRLGFTSYLSNKHINSGVIFCADIPETHRIFDRWHELWSFSNSKNIVRDQPAFNMAILENQSVFTELDGTWNCQISFNGLPFLANSKIIHYFASDAILRTSPFLLASNEIFAKIKSTGEIPARVIELLKSPRTAFAPEARIVAGEEVLSVVNSSIFEFLILIRRRMPPLFIFLDVISTIIKRILKHLVLKTGGKRDGRTYN